MKRPLSCAPLYALVLLLPLAACKPVREAAAPPDANELVALRAEVERLRKENADLRISPHALAAEVEAAIRAGSDDKAVAAYKQLSDTFPVAAETQEVRRRLEAFQAQRRVQDEESRRIAALGFKALPVTPSFTHEDTAVTLTSSAITRRWTFDSYGEGWRFLDAEKDKKLLVARLNVSSKQKEPNLFGIAAYVADGPKLVRVGTARYRFARWSSFGAFLGTQADYRNEFSHSWRIPFTVGVQVKDEDLKRGPIYLVASREGCNQRHYDRFGQPPVLYLPGKCDSLKPALVAEDFRDGALALLKRVDMQ